MIMIGVYRPVWLQDKNNIPLWLGVGPSGIVQCLHENRNDPVMVSEL